jgi:hypothetical protein
VDEYGRKIVEILREELDVLFIDTAKTRGIGRQEPGDRHHLCSVADRSYLGRRFRVGMNRFGQEFLTSYSS